MKENMRGQPTLEERGDRLFCRKRRERTRMINSAVKGGLNFHRKGGGVGLIVFCRSSKRKGFSGYSLGKCGKGKINRNR